MTHADPTVSLAERIDGACDRFEAEWKVGRRPRIDDFVAAAPESDREALRQALIAIDLELEGRGNVDTSRTGDSVRTGSQSRPEATVQHHEEVDATPAAIGRFEIRGTLGSGAFGRVYRAFDPQLGREVALKVPLDSALRTDDERSRFLKEARSAATINHANVCQILEVGESDGRPYIVMALVPGQSLAETIKTRKEPLPEKQVALIVRKIAIALAAAHEKGIVHRDLKPANVMFDRERRDIIVMDFGLARGPRLADARDTQSGVIMGTPAYMSPEQASGGSKDVGPAGDVFSLGVILYELLTGTRPFTGTATEVIGQILHVEPEKPSQRRTGIDPRLEAVCLKAIAKEPTARFATMKEFARAIEAILREPKPVTASSETLQANQTRVEGEESTNMADVFAAMSMDRRQTRAETAAVVEAAIAKHRTPRWIFVAIALLFMLGLSGITGIVFFTRSDKVKVDLTVVLNDVDLKDKSLSFFLDEEPISAEALANPVELKPGDHVFTVKSGNTIVKRMLIKVAGGRNPGIKVSNIDPPPQPVEPKSPKASPLDELKAADIPDALLNKIYGGRDKAPAELVAIYSNIRPGGGDDYHGFDIGMDGRTLFTARYPWDMIEVRNLANGRKFKELGINEPRGDPFFAWLAAAPDGSMVYGLRKAEAHRMRKTEDLYVFNIQGKELWRKPIRSNWSTPALAPDGATLVAADVDERVNVLHVLDAKTGAQRAKWSGILAGPTCRLQFSPDGRTLAVMSAGTLKLVNAADGTVTKTLVLPKAPGIPVFSWDGKKVYHSHNWQEPEDYFAETDLTTDKTREYRLPPKGCRMAVANPAYPIVVSSGVDNNLHFWDTEVGPNQRPYKLSLGCPAERYLFTPEGRYLVVGCDNGVFVFRLPVDKKVAEWNQTNANGPKVSAPAADPDRAAAEWAQRLKAIVVVDVAGEEKRFVATEALPSAKFKLIGVYFRGQDIEAAGGLIPLKGLTNLRELSLWDAKLTDDHLRDIEGMTSLRHLNLHAVPITDACMSSIATLPNLEELWLHYRPITDAGISKIAGLKKIKRLLLSRTKVGPDGIKLIGGMPDLEHLDLGGTGATDDSLAHLANLRKLKQLNIEGTLLTGSGLKHLARLPALEKLQIGDGIFAGTGNVTDEGLRSLSELKTLRSLSVANSVSPRLTGATLKVIGMLTGLEELHVSIPACANEDLAQLKNLTQLTHLTVRCPKVTDEGLAHVAGMQRLSMLWLEGTAITGAGFVHVAKLPRLTDLRAADTLLSDTGLEHLTGLRQLVHVHFQRTKLTDKGLEVLAKVPSLRFVQVENTTVTNAGLRKFKSARPECQILPMPKGDPN